MLTSDSWDYLRVILMPLSLTLNPAASPLPFAALVAAAYKGVPIAFDDSVASAVLVDGTAKIPDNKILSTLAPSVEDAGAKVCLTNKTTIHAN